MIWARLRFKFDKSVRVMMMFAARFTFKIFKISLSLIASSGANFAVPAHKISASISHAAASARHSFASASVSSKRELSVKIS